MPSPVGYRTDDRIGRKSTPALAARVTPWLSRVVHGSAVRPPEPGPQSGLTAEFERSYPRSDASSRPSPRSRDTRSRHRVARPGARRPRPDARRDGRPREPRGPAGRGPDATPHRPPHRRPRGGLGDRPVRPPGGRGQRGDGPRGRDAGHQRAARVRRRRARGRAGAHPEAGLHRAGSPRVPPRQGQRRSRSRWRTTPRRWPTTRPGRRSYGSVRVPRSPPRSSPGPGCCSATRGRPPATDPARRAAVRAAPGRVRPPVATEASPARRHRPGHTSRGRR